MTDIAKCATCGESHPLRWNCRVGDGKVFVCENNHERSQGCDWHAFVPLPQEDAAIRTEYEQGYRNGYAEGAGANADSSLVALRVREHFAAAPPAPRAPQSDEMKVTFIPETGMTRYDIPARATGEGEAPTRASIRKQIEAIPEGVEDSRLVAVYAPVNVWRELLTERATLVEAARKFVPTARHSIGCSLVPCDCGLNEMVAALRASLSETTNG